jgi:hypothetical protein
MLETVAAAFDDCLNQVVFIGGATLGLFATSPSAPAHRPTQDIDCLINAPSRAFLHDWDRMLPERGFVKLDPREQPALFWHYDGIHVHLLPPYSEMIGFENRWFEEGLFHATYCYLPSGRRIRTFNTVYFLATKLEALAHRGWEDLRMSEDFEDIIFLVEHRPELIHDIQRAFHEVRSYLQSRLKALLAHPDLEEGLAYVLPGEVTSAQISRILLLLDTLANGQQAAMQA